MRVLPFKMIRIAAMPSGRAVTLRGHQTGELGGVNLANIAEMFGYSDDPFSMLYQQLTGASVTCCEMRLDFVRCEVHVMRSD